MSSKDKSKSNKSKDHKITSKPQAPTPPTTSTDQEPENFGFLYTIDALEATYDDNYPQRILPIGSGKGNDIAFLWFPPVRAKMFKRSNGKIYQWREDGSQVLENYPRPQKKFEVASVFFQARQDNFLAVFKDCAKHDIADEVHGWSQIGFHHNPQCLSEVDIGGERPLLAAPARGSTWMPQVVPEVYNYDKNPSVKFTGEPGGLCGKLSLLIAMAAFSADVGHAEATVARCFCFGEWIKHTFETGIGRYQNRGVVVSIYLDPDAKDVSSAHLKAFERGKYGPIFATGQSQLSSAAQQASYTHEPTTTPTNHGTQSAVPRGYNYQIPTLSSGYAAPSGYTASGGYSVPAGYATTSGFTAPSGYATTQMFPPSTNLYDEEDDVSEVN